MPLARPLTLTPMIVLPAVCAGPRGATAGRADVPDAESVTPVRADQLGYASMTRLSCTAAAAATASTQASAAPARRQVPTRSQSTASATAVATTRASATTTMGVPSSLMPAAT